MYLGISPENLRNYIFLVYYFFIHKHLYGKNAYSSECLVKYCITSDFSEIFVKLLLQLNCGKLILLQDNCCISLGEMKGSWWIEQTIPVPDCVKLVKLPMSHPLSLRGILPKLVTQVQVLLTVRCHCLRASQVMEKTDDAWRECLKTSWPASCWGKGYWQQSFIAVIALSNQIWESQKEDSRHFHVTCANATLPS